VYPDLVKIGDYVVPPYSFLLWFGIGVGVLVALRLGRRAGLDDRDVLFPAAWAVGVALVGARLFSVLFDGSLQSYLRRPLRVFEFWNGGLVYYGGLLGGMAGAWWGARRRGIAYLDLADLFAPAVTVGLGFGRIGCLLSGCCYGAPTDFPIAMTYTNPASHVGPLGEPLHAAPLYEAVAAFAIGIWLVRRYPRRKYAGDVLSMALLLYAPARFAIEFLRADSRGSLAAISTSQWISVGLFALGLWLRRSGPAAGSEAVRTGRGRGRRR
jgi:phosphatidylglycerol:prolipoprotein diacylglycerol transferase